MNFQRFHMADVLFWRLFPITSTCKPISKHFLLLFCFLEVIIGLLYGRWWWGLEGLVFIIGSLLPAPVWHSSIIVFGTVTKNSWKSSGDLSMTWIMGSHTILLPTILFFPSSTAPINISENCITERSLKPISRLLRHFNNFFFISNDYFFFRGLCRLFLYWKTGQNYHHPKRGFFFFLFGPGNCWGSSSRNNTHNTCGVASGTRYRDPFCIYLVSSGFVSFWGPIIVQ